LLRSIRPEKLFAIQSGHKGHRSHGAAKKSGWDNRVLSSKV
jgi:hypothetical protein